MADIFISYSKARGAEAAELAKELADLGYDVWWDTSLLPTGSYGAEIDRQLDAAKAVIVIWSLESVRSKWVRSEASHADRQDKLINTNIAGLDPVSQIPKPFDQTHSVEFDDIRAIVRALDALGVPRSGGTPLPDLAGRAPVSVADAGNRLFAEVEKSGTAEAFQFYLDEFPQGAHAPVVRFKLKVLKDQEAAGAIKRAAEQLAAQEERHRTEGRIKVDAKLVHGAPDGWFKPGAGKSEWFKDNETGPEMVVVPAGEFIMGSPNSEKRYDGYDGREEPQRKVVIKTPLAVGRFAVTFDEWDAAFAAGGVEQKPETGWGRGRQPVTSVSWEDASSYCAWLSEASSKSYRLLSEAEWEYCCRAGTTSPFWWGSTISPNQANYDGNYTYGTGKKGEYRIQTLPVDSFEPNPWWLYQVHGNVWEWCEDNWHANYGGSPPKEGSVWPGGDTSSRVLRGGSWYLDPDDLRSAYRGNYLPVNRNYLLGFRLAWTL